MRTWTSAADLQAQVQRLWDQGRLLACLAGGDEAFPLRLTLRRPTSAELSERFDEVRAWSRGLLQAQGCRVVMVEVRHRVIGRNDLPSEAWVDSLDDALRLIGKIREARRFASLVAVTRTCVPALVPWLQTHPLRALALSEHWLRLLDIVRWLRDHPRPGLYLRQVDLPGVHSKYIEEHATVLGELFDLALPADAIDASVSGAANLARRYGFRAKPVRVRFRLLDQERPLLGTGAAEDITVDHETFARLAPALPHVYVTENEVNFLAFPPMQGAMVVFGGGYGFEALAEARWLQERTIHYWGDIDTHGFAILDQLRGHFPHVESCLMDRATLLAHREQWTDEPQPVLRDLMRLSPSERGLFDDLRWKRLEGRHLRLEQERIGFEWVRQALEEQRAGARGIDVIQA